MKIGFIGTGHISKSVINGILGSKLKINKIEIKNINKLILFPSIMCPYPLTGIT